MMIVFKALKKIGYGAIAKKSSLNFFPLLRVVSTPSVERRKRLEAIG